MTGHINKMRDTSAPTRSINVRFSNRRFDVEHFQTIRRCSVDVVHGLSLLFGIGTKALPSWDSRTRQNDLSGGLVVSSNGRFKRTCELTSSIVPRGHLSTAGWISSFSPIGFDHERVSCCCHGWLLGRPELGAVNPYAVQDGQPASQRHDRLLHSAAPGDLHGPGLEPGPFLPTQHALRCFVEHHPHISSPQRDILPFQSISPD